MIYLMEIWERYSDHEWVAKSLIEAESDEQADEIARAFVRQWRGSAEPRDENDEDEGYDSGGITMSLDRAPTPVATFEDLVRAMGTLTLEPCHVDGCTALPWRWHEDGNIYCREHTPEAEDE